MELIFPEIWHRQDALAYRQEHIDNEESHIHGSGGLLRAENYEGWLEKIISFRDSAPKDWVNGSTYFALVNGIIVGTIQVRHTLNDTLRSTGGHIGYGIRPSERRKGYGAQMLALALIKSRSLGIERALITCDKGNIASAKTALRNGGELENEIMDEDGIVVQRYWVTL